MKTAGVLVLIAGVSGLPFSAMAQLIERFDYEDGPLSQVSGGLWTIWPFYDDASVESGKAVQRYGQTNETDVFRVFDSVATAPGTSASFSYDVTVPDIYSDDHYRSYLWLSPYANGAEVIDQSLVIDFNSESANRVRLRVWEGQGNGQIFSRFVGYFAAGETYTMSGVIARGAKAAYSLFLDGSLVREGEFALTDPNGLNVVELYGQPGRTGVVSYDNIEILPVPEPATILGLAGGAALLAWRRKTRRGPSP